MSDIPDKNHTMEQFNVALIKAVKKRDYVYGTLFDEVVIEQQPAGGHNKFACVTMKILSHALYLGTFLNTLHHHLDLSLLL